MSEAVQLALVGLLGAGVTAVSAIIIAKLNRIHTLANSNLAAANARLDIALGKIDGQGTEIAALKELLTVQRAATPTGPVPVTIENPAPVDVAVVEKT